jgi:hypothetical protein
VLSSVLLKRALSTGRSVALPTATGPDGLTNEFTIFTNSKDETKAAYVLDGTPHFEIEYLSSLIQADYGRFITVIPDPVESFLLAWEDRGMSTKLKALGESGDLISALKSTRAEVVSLLESIRNQFAKRFAPKDTKDSIGSFQIIKLLRQQSFLLTIPGGMRDEMLVYLRRRGCWSMEDMSFIQAEWSDKMKRHSISKEALGLIEAFNALDVAVYNHYDKEMHTVLSTEMGVAKEVAELVEQRAKDRRDCVAASTLTQEAIVERLRASQSSDIMRTDRCLLMYLKPASYPLFFEARMGTGLRKARP